MVWEKPKRLRNGLGRRPKRLKNQSSEVVWEKSWEKPKKAQKWSGKLKLLSFGPEKGKTVGNGPGKASPAKVPGRSEPGNGLEGGGPGCTSKSGGGAGLHEQRSLGGARLHQQRSLGGGQVAPAKGLGFRVFTFDTQRLDRLDGQCGPYLALERPAAPALPGLHVQCSQVAREARTASGSQVLVASKDFRV